MTVCYTVWTLARPVIGRAARHIGHHLVRHKVAYVGFAAVTVCVAARAYFGPLSLPPVMAPPFEMPQPGTDALQPTPVSEPGTLALLLPAAGAVLLIRRRTQRSTRR